jgi:hypothetical protein
MSWSFQVKDVSFAGSSVTVAGIKVTDFMDDANTVEFQDVDVSSVGVNCNGSMIRNAKPNVIMMSITVIPGSKSDDQLYSLWKQYRVQGQYNRRWEDSLSASVSIGSGRGSRSFSNGTMVGGPGGPSSNGEGKMQGRTYTFAFVTVN